ncbi:hypothetical protein [Xanthomonas phaseoli]
MTTSRKTTTRNRAPDMPKDPHEVERRAYLQQMLDEGFDPADWRICNLSSVPH